MKVLVVDDNRILADTIQEILEQDGLDVMSAKDGLDGYATYLLFKPDIIITDIQMPRKNGLEMMKRIRIHNPMIKTIYLSGNIGSFEPFLIEEKKIYPVNYFKKPFSLESLMRVVAEPTVNLADKECGNTGPGKGCSFDCQSDDFFQKASVFAEATNNAFAGQ
jgi:CheY-like chemotaxis protein